MSSSMEVKPTINVVNFFYFFEKKPKPMSSSVEAKLTFNVVNIFTKIIFSRKVQIIVVINGDFEGLE
jgi:hypothetical protein